MRVNVYAEEMTDRVAVTFWGKRDLREVLQQALALLDEHYAQGKRKDGG